ncbi:MAG: response regulator [Variibacter sp.]|nr:response regulator [Variibacter sp.]
MTTPTRLLYVDDDAGLRRLVERGLSPHGFEVTLAPDGRSGLERLQQGEFDVVALDQFMPGFDGMETLAEIQKLSAPPPVIFVTGAQESRLAIAALKAGAADYVLKDVQGEFIPLLRAAVEGALNSARMRRAKEAAEAEVRAARDRFEALAAERAVLLREVNHRVGNSLQLIAALLQMHGANSPSGDVKAALTNAVSRVMAVAQVHRRLYTSGDVQTVAVDQYLNALVDDLRASIDEPQRALLTFEGEPLETDPDSAVALGVMVNELVINALKYAYPSRTPGPIRVQLRRPAEQRAELIVEDEGVGDRPAAASGSTGLGRRIVDAMATKLNAQVARDASHAGTRVTIALAPKARAER